MFGIVPLSETFSGNGVGIGVIVGVTVGAGTVIVTVELLAMKL